MPVYSGEQISPGTLRAYSTVGKAFVEQVTMSAELKDLTENLPLHCKILREK